MFDKKKSFELGQRVGLVCDNQLAPFVAFPGKHSPSSTNNKRKKERKTESNKDRFKEKTLTGVQ